MDISEAMTVEASEQTTQDALVALQLEVERLRAIENRVRLLCNPPNPTGYASPPRTVLVIEILAALSED